MTKQQTAESRRAQILAAAMQVCAERGYHGARIDDIAAAAGLSKGAVYHHFPDGKDELFLALLEGMIDEFAQAFRDVPPTERAAAALRRIFELNVAQTRGMESMARGLVEFYMLAMHKPEMRDQFRRHYDDFVAAGVALIERGMREGDFDPALDAGAIAPAFWMALDGVVLVLVSLDRAERSADAMQTLVDVLFRALAPRKESA